MKRAAFEVLGTLPFSRPQIQLDLEGNLIEAKGGT
jgi:hypothetical protein